MRARAMLLMGLVGCGFGVPGNNSTDGDGPLPPDSSDGGDDIGFDATVDGDPDAAPLVDAPPDAPAELCRGSGMMQTCVSPPPTAPRTVTGPVNTDQDCDHVVAIPPGSGTQYCVLAGTTLTVTDFVRATGSRPLVLFAAETIDINDSISATSTRASTGAGANPAACGAPGASANHGGGAGGSNLTRGASGGGGGGGAVGGTSAAALALAPRGGCAGGGGSAAGANSVAANGGPGGGAVLLVAGTRITMNDLGPSSAITAGGAGGGGGGPEVGGGGGGAGGFLGFDAPMVQLRARYLAAGGGGGEGGGMSQSGDPGAEGLNPTGGARGGDDNPYGGNGGTGSAPAAGPTNGSEGSTADGGGGGGAGAIYVHATTVDLSGDFNPGVTEL